MNWRYIGFREPGPNYDLHLVEYVVCVIITVSLFAVVFGIFKRKGGNRG